MQKKTDDEKNHEEIGREKFLCLNILYHPISRQLYVSQKRSFMLSVILVYVALQLEELIVQNGTPHVCEFGTQVSWQISFHFQKINPSEQTEREFSDFAP